MSKTNTSLTARITRTLKNGERYAPQDARHDVIRTAAGEARLYAEAGLRGAWSRSLDRIRAETTAEERKAEINRRLRVVAEAFNATGEPIAATYGIGSDSYPIAIVEISASGKTIKCERGKVYTWRKRGGWVERGSRWGRVGLGVATRALDPHF